MHRRKNGWKCGFKGKKGDGSMGKNKENATGERQGKNSKILMNILLSEQFSKTVKLRNRQWQFVLALLRYSWIESNNDKYNCN